MNVHDPLVEKAPVAVFAPAVIMLHEGEPNAGGGALVTSQVTPASRRVKTTLPPAGIVRGAV